MVAHSLADARAPWWVIGSAAVALHGGETEVADVDVLLAAQDAERLAAMLTLRNGAGDRDPLFRSAWFMRWTVPPLPVEFMADLRVRSDAGWRAVAPATRVTVGDGVFVPPVAELRAMLALFGRPKDRARAALLDAVASRPEHRVSRGVDPGTRPG